MPDEVRAEISPWFIEQQAIKEDIPEKIEKLDDNAKYIISGLQVSPITRISSSHGKIILLIDGFISGSQKGVIWI